MANKSRTEVRYLPQRCPLLHQDVWAIVTRQPDGSWRIVNCLDKDEPCHTLDCAFTASGGTWPFRGTAVVSRP